MGQVCSSALVYEPKTWTNDEATFHLAGQRRDGYILEFL